MQYLGVIFIYFSYFSSFLILKGNLEVKRVKYRNVAMKKKKNGKIYSWKSVAFESI